MNITKMRVVTVVVALLLGSIVTLTLSSRNVRASAGRSYHADVLYEALDYKTSMQDRIQRLLDDRASEGWELVSASAFPEAVHPQGGENVLGVVLVFKK